MTPEFSEKTIIRRQRDAANPYFMLARDVAQNKQMTYAALGLLAYLLSKPDNWQIMVEDLKRAGCGRDKANGLLRELKAAGHLFPATPKQDHDKQGRFAAVEWIVTETPVTEKPSTVNPSTGKPSTVNPPLHSKELQNPESVSSELESQETQVQVPNDPEPPTAGSARAGVQTLDKTPINAEMEKATPDEIATALKLVNEEIQFVTPHVAEVIMSMIDVYGLANLRLAIHEAAINGNRKISYLESICKRLIGDASEGRIYASTWTPK